MPFFKPTSFFMCVIADFIAGIPAAEDGIFSNSIPVSFLGGWACIFLVLIILIFL